MTKEEFYENFQLSSEPPSTWLCNRSSGLKYTSQSGCIFVQCASDLESGESCNNEIYIIRKGRRHMFSFDDIDDAMVTSVFLEQGCRTIAKNL